MKGSLPVRARRRPATASASAAWWVAVEALGPGRRGRRRRRRKPGCVPGDQPRAAVGPDAVHARRRCAYRRSHHCGLGRSAGRARSGGYRHQGPCRWWDSTWYRFAEMLAPDDIAYLIYTSGTTVLPKGWRSPTRTWRTWRKSTPTHLPASTGVDGALLCSRRIFQLRVVARWSRDWGGVGGGCCAGYLSRAHRRHFLYPPGRSRTGDG